MGQKLILPYSPQTNLLFYGHREKRLTLCSGNCTASLLTHSDQYYSTENVFLNESSLWQPTCADSHHYHRLEPVLPGISSLFLLLYYWTSSGEKACKGKKKLSTGNSLEQPHRRHLKLRWGIRFSITEARLLTCPGADLLTCSEEYMTCQGLLASSLNVSPFCAPVFHLASADVMVPMSVHLDCKQSFHSLPSI